MIILFNTQKNNAWNRAFVWAWAGSGERAYAKARSLTFIFSTTARAKVWAMIKNWQFNDII
jgi:hypothetical protein